MVQEKDAMKAHTMAEAPVDVLAGPMVRPTVVMPVVMLVDLMAVG